jgi:hypothetical protein
LFFDISDSFGGSGFADFVIREPNPETKQDEIKCLPESGVVHESVLSEIEQVVADNTEPERFTDHGLIPSRISMWL